MISKSEMDSYLGIDINTEIEIVDGGQLILNESMQKERKYWQNKINEPNPVFDLVINKFLDDLVEQGILVKGEK